MNQNQDEQHLQLLSIFHFVVACITGFISLFPLIHVVLGIAILNGAFENQGDQPPPPPFIGWIFVIGPGFMILMGFTFAICIALVGLKLRRRKSYLFCLIVAGAECIMMPFGTVLGVFTIIVLMRPSVKSMFGVPVNENATAPPSQGLPTEATPAE